MRVWFSPKSEHDLAEIGDYIAADSPRRAVAFIKSLRKRALAIGRLAEGYPLVGFGPPGMRRGRHGHYAIYFTIEGNKVRIERVLHGARDHSALLDEN